MFKSNVVENCFIREMTGLDQKNFSKFVKSDKNLTDIDISAWLIENSARNEDGSRYYKSRDEVLELHVKKIKKLIKEIEDINEFDNNQEV